MIWKMEKHSDGQKTMLRRMGQIQSEQLEELQAQITDGGPRMVLDLDEVTLGDVIQDMGPATRPTAKVWVGTGTGQEPAHRIW